MVPGAGISGERKVGAAKKGRLRLASSCPDWGKGDENSYQ